MAEFTGERVVPGLVDDDLFNEHVARYRFAAHLARRFHGRAEILDAGCGTGYGAAALTQAGSVTAFDVSPEAIRYARGNTDPGVRFAQARCEALPFCDGAFDMVCAFEVIEHLENWQALLAESKRVLKPGGVLLVSTPNKAYYAEARAEAGPNPFHAHEFEYAEFRGALGAVFPHVTMLTQNHAPAVVFAPAKPASARLDAAGDDAPASAHFFFAICADAPLDAEPLFAWIPQSGNVLRERERHISEIDGMLRESVRAHSALQQEHERLLAELRERNAWALRQDAALEEARDHISRMEREAEERLSWIAGLERRIDAGVAEIARLNTHREELERESVARAAWGFALDAEVAALGAEVTALGAHAAELTEEIEQRKEERRAIAESRWLRLGMKLNLGPRVE